MNPVQQERYKAIIEQVAKKYDLPYSVVNGAYRGFWLFVRNYVSNVHLKQDGLSKEEFSKLKPNVNLPSLGKLAVTYDRYIGMKLRYKYIQKLRNNDKCKSD